MALRRSCHPTQLAPPPAARAAAQLSALPVAQQCTQMPRNGSEEPFSPICVHYCVTTGRPRNPRVATVYTNAPKRLREAVFGDLCTLLRHHGAPARASRRRSRHNSVHKCPRTAPKDRFRQSVYTIVSPCVPTGARATLAPQLSAQQCTQMPRNGVERPFSAICVHYCVTTGRLRHHRPPARASRRNSVHNHEAPNILAPGRRTSPRSG